MTVRGARSFSYNAPVVAPAAYTYADMVNELVAPGGASGSSIVQEAKAYWHLLNPVEPLGIGTKIPTLVGVLFVGDSLYTIPSVMTGPLGRVRYVGSTLQEITYTAADTTEVSLINGSKVACATPDKQICMVYGSADPITPSTWHAYLRVYDTTTDTNFSYALYDVIGDVNFKANAIIANPANSDEVIIVFADSVNDRNMIVVASLSAVWVVKTLEFAVSTYGLIAGAVTVQPEGTVMLLTSTGYIEYDPTTNTLGTTHAPTLPVGYTSPRQVGRKLYTPSGNGAANTASARTVAYNVDTDTSATVSRILDAGYTGATATTGLVYTPDQRLVLGFDPGTVSVMVVNTVTGLAETVYSAGFDYRNGPGVTAPDGWVYMANLGTSGKLNRIRIPTTPQPTHNWCSYLTFNNF